MYVFYDLLYGHPFLALAQGAFTLWMLVDAYRRQAETFWLFVILLVPFFGSWSYFFIIKLKDFRGLDFSFLKPKTSLAELRYRAEQIPTLANHLALAERLIEMQDFDAALVQLEAARKKEPAHGQVQYFLALCHTRQGRPQQALPLLESLTQRDPRWSNYLAWRLLIETHEANHNPQAALSTCQQLTSLSPTLENKCILADMLRDAGENREARRLLEGALQDHQFAPGPIRRRNRRWASEARRLLQSIP